MKRSLHSFVAQICDTSSSQRRCDWSFMDGGFVQVEPFQMAREWLARDLVHHHPISVVELRGPKGAAAALYYDLDHIPLQFLDRTVDHFVQNVLPDIVATNIANITSPNQQTAGKLPFRPLVVVTSTPPDEAGTVGAHIIVPNIITPVDVAKRIRHILCRLDR